MKTHIENFKLRKIKIKREGVHMEYTMKFHEGQEVHEVTSKTDYAYLPHIDLTDVLEKYKPMLATVFYYDKCKGKDQDEIMSKITVNEITLSGSDNTRGVLISGNIKSINNRPLNLNSENLRYNSSKYGFEDLFEDLEEEIIREAYAFAFEDKKGQLTMFSDVEQEGLEEMTQDNRNAAIAEDEKAD